MAFDHLLRRVRATQGPRARDDGGETNHTIYSYIVGQRALIIPFIRRLIMQSGHSRDPHVESGAG